MIYLLRCFFIVFITINFVFPASAIQRDELDKLVGDYGIVDHFHEGNNNTVLIVLEENHASILTQLQEAIILERLYKNKGMKAIGIEGYLKDDAKIALDTSWFKNTELGSIQRNELATNYLQQGEISAGEFMKLVHNDITIVPVELKIDYNIDRALESNSILWADKLSELILNDLGQKTRDSLIKAMDEVKIFIQNDEILSIDEVMEKIHYFLKLSLPESLADISDDPELKVAGGLFDEIKQNKGDINVEIDLVQRLISFSDKNAIFSDEESDKMKNYLNFLKKRSHSSDTMTKLMIDYINQSGSGFYSLIIGAGHTEEIIELLSQKKITFSIITPTSVESRIVDLSRDRYNQKMLQQSIDQTYLGDLLNEIYPPFLNNTFNLNNDKIKPQMVINQEWIKAKTEVYDLVDNINRWSIENRNTKLELPETEYVSVDMNSISFDGDTTQFLLKFKRKGKLTNKELWVKTQPHEGYLASKKAEYDVEQLLKHAIKKVEIANKTNKSTSESFNFFNIFKNSFINRFQVSISKKTNAIFAYDIDTLKQLSFSK